jgi:hypothetical protein
MKADTENWYILFTFPKSKITKYRVLPNSARGW